ncbi:MAG: cytochrome c [Candidatus Melainabacteria bacterium]
MHRNFVPTLAFGVICGALLSGCAGGGNETAQAPVEPVAMPPGQQVFMDSCLGCHAGPGDPPGPDERITKSKKMVSKEKLLLYLRNPDNMNMPPIAPEQVSDAQVSELFDYLNDVITHP